VVKRHNFGGGRASHGGKSVLRRGGSIGCREWPGRVFKNRKMPGQMGNVRVTTQNLKIVQVREDDNAILVRGSIPGANGSVVLVRKAIKKG
jgi:large subunit ribosomal protein L3